MNPYLKNLNKIEFVVTYACTGRCKHCSEGEHASSGERISPEIAADAVRKIAAEYEVKTVLAFGGEPLLYPDAVEKIMSAAKDVNIEKRQIITNGYFSSDSDKIRETVKMLSFAGVNELLLSVDAFHQETIPIEIVKNFAKELTAAKIPVKLQPAWLVSRAHDNPYNRKTREILNEFRDTGIPENEGNVIFPEGNAKKFLAEYFNVDTPENPYIENPCNIKCVSFEPNGDILGRNVYKSDIMDIINNYVPKGLKKEML